MLKRPCFAGFPSRMAVLALAHARIFFDGEHPLGQEAVRKIERRTAVNRSRRSQMRTYVRKVEEAIASGDHGAAAAALRDAEPLVMRAAQKGIVHSNTARESLAIKPAG